ncbi:hypothetical protein C5167_003971, partial [Papaver somniferum]
MENGLFRKKWSSSANDDIHSASGLTVKEFLNTLMKFRNPEDERQTIPLGHGDPSAFPCFRTTQIADDAVVDSVRSAKFNGYSSTLSPDDVFLTIGCAQAIEIAMTVFTRPGANILLPRPGFPYYEACAGFRKLEYRHFDLLPDKGWEVDLEAVEALADENTLGIVIINPGNPCGNVYTYEHLKKVAETAKKLGIIVMADEVYAHLTFGSNPFVPMGVFGSIAPVLTLGSISKRWIVPGWRLGWLVSSDPNGILKETK